MRRAYTRPELEAPAALGRRCDPSPGRAFAGHRFAIAGPVRGDRGTVLARRGRRGDAERGGRRRRRRAGGRGGRDRAGPCAAATSSCSSERRSTAGGHAACSARRRPARAAHARRGCESLDGVAQPIPAIRVEVPGAADRVPAHVRRRRPGRPRPSGSTVPRSIRRCSIPRSRRRRRPPRRDGPGGRRSDTADASRPRRRGADRAGVRHRRRRRPPLDRRARRRRGHAPAASAPHRPHVPRRGRADGDRPRRPHGRLPATATSASRRCRAVASTSASCSGRRGAERLAARRRGSGRAGRARGDPAVDGGPGGPRPIVRRIAGAAPARQPRRRGAPGPAGSLVGDAAGFLDPFTGEGLHRALVSARLAATAIDAELSGRSPARLAAYDRAMRRRFLGKDLVSWLFQAFLAQPALFDTRCGGWRTGPTSVRDGPRDGRPRPRRRGPWTRASSRAAPPRDRRAEPVVERTRVGAYAICSATTTASCCRIAAADLGAGALDPAGRRRRVRGAPGRRGAARARRGDGPRRRIEELLGIFSAVPSR